MVFSPQSQTAAENDAATPQDDNPFPAALERAYVAAQTKMGIAEWQSLSPTARTQAVYHMMRKANEPGVRGAIPLISDTPTAAPSPGLKRANRHQRPMTYDIEITGCFSEKDLIFGMRATEIERAFTWLTLLRHRHTDWPEVERQIEVYLQERNASIFHVLDQIDRARQLFAPWLSAGA